MKKLHREPRKSKNGKERNPLFVSLQEAGYMLGVSERTVRRWSETGILPPIIKIGGCCRISRQGIIDYINRISVKMEEVTL
jgi:predicted site-specific integrase-resolvase